MARVSLCSVLAAGGCARPPPVAQPPPVVTVAPRPAGDDTAARVAALLAADREPRWPWVELVILPQLGPAPPLAHEPRPPPKPAPGTLTIHGDPGPTRGLSNADLTALESSEVAARTLPCFVRVRPGTSATVALVSVSEQFVAAKRAQTTELERCLLDAVEPTATKFGVWGWYEVVATRRGARSLQPASELELESQLLERALADEADAARRTLELLALARREVDRWLLEPAQKPNALERAAERLRRAIDVKAPQPSVLFALGMTLRLGGHLSQAIDPLRAAVCPDPVPDPGYQSFPPATQPEAWRALADAHADDDPKRDPYCLVRAAAAYQRAIEAARHAADREAEAFARLALVRTSFRQGRYRAAMGHAVALLETQPSAAIVDRACQFVASSAMQEDFDGPAEGAPYTEPEDIFDNVLDWGRNEARLAASYGRVHDSSLVPQDRPWTSRVYFWLTLEDAWVGFPTSTNRMATDYLARWPLQRDAPLVAVARAGAQVRAASMMLSTDRRRAAAVHAADAALDALGQYLEDSPWRRANGHDQPAVVRAETAVRQVLERKAHLAP